MTLAPGVRVLRGPHWESGDDDGGEGHLGTLTELLGNGLVRVLWDNGNESTCKAGADGKYELRMFDTAPIGIQHKGTQCSGCDEKDIYGMLWRCTQCSNCTLCPLCYVMDKHDAKHIFERIDEEGQPGEKLKKRSVSLRIRAVGIFPGAVVTRGKDWMWGDQDGGPGSVGQVLGFENVAPTSSRNLVRVKWEGKDSANSYRLGFDGQVDVKCVEESAGIHYYREHLPVIDATGKKPTSMFSASTKPSSSSTSSSGGAVGGVGAGAEGRGGGGEGRVFGAGDKVAVQIDEERLKQMQADYGGCTAGMVACIGKTGEVVSLAPNGAVSVKFKRLNYRFNPNALVKVPSLSVGDVVRIRPDLEQLKALNKRVGWKSEMDETAGKVGKVVKIDEDGDVAVAFGRRIYMYAPACCVAAADCRPDELGAHSVSSVGSGSGSGSGNHEQGDLHRKLMKMLAGMVNEGSDDGDDDRSEMSQLFKAVNLGDSDAVKSVCQAQPELLRKVHKGMTLLMVACHEAKRDIVNALLDLGAPIDAKGEKGNTALGAALEGKKESIALLLLQRGASPSQLNAKGRCPAHVAAYNNMTEALAEIIKRGADVNVKDEYGDAPLHDAIEKDNVEAIDALMEAPNLDLQLQNRKGFNMLQLACLRGNVHAVEKILQRDKRHVDDLMKGEFNALMIAVTNDHVECARLLIAEGNASLNIKGSQGLTALHLSCNEAYPRSVELLLNSGADVNIAAADGNTPLHLAIGTKSTQLRKNPSERLEQQEHRHRVQIACMLMEKGAYIDAKNNKGAEPIQCCRPDAIRKGFQQFIKENPQVIKRKGGGGASAGRSRANLSTSQVLGSLLQRLNLPCGRCQGQANITLKPCGHKALCRDCCLKVTECPVCHQFIEHRVASGSSGSDDVSKAAEQLQEACKQS